MIKYNEIMERLTVSDQMKEKLIVGVDKTDRDKSKIIRASTVRRIAAIAACFVLLIVGVIVIKNLNGDNVAPGGEYTGGPIDQTPWGAAVYGSAADLSKASGIEIEDLKNVPFEATEIAYQDYENNLVEILYSNGDESISYRVSKGDEDNSGDSNEYSNVFEKEIDGAVYTLKGEGDLIYCVLYSRGEYSYSITSTMGLTLKQIEDMH